MIDGQGYPNLEDAIALWKKGVEIRRVTMGLAEDPDYIIHTETVADFARKIASEIKGFDPDKAYIGGLLHDHGKTKRERENDKFHGLEGYELLMAEGYPGPARICLTHTFANKPVSLDDIGYPERWMRPLIALLKEIEYDDYDRLIQFCDKLCDGTRPVTVEQRATAIRDRYNNIPGHCVSERRYLEIISEGRRLKSYFDGLCGTDTYALLGLKDG